MSPQRDGWFSGGELPCDPVPPLRNPPSRSILVGPTGVGEGTQAKMLSQRLLARHLSTGDLFRAAVCDGASSAAMQEALGGHAPRRFLTARSRCLDRWVSPDNICRAED